MLTLMLQKIQAAVGQICSF